MNDISNYNSIYNLRKNYLIYIFIGICFIIFLIVIIFKNVYYESYYVNSGIFIEKDKIKVYVSNSDLNKITTNNKIKIKNKKFAYKIYSISDILFNGDNYYYEVIIESNINYNINIVNNFIEFKIPLQKMTILEYILKKVGGI